MLIWEKLLTSLQYVLPQHFLSRILGYLSECKKPLILKNFAIKVFIKFYNVNMEDALYPEPSSYPNFNAFFTRPLKKDKRPIANLSTDIASPADGLISQQGIIIQQNILQAKNHFFTVTELLGGQTERATPFINGSFMTIYLAPRDYHRVHMPYAGHLKEMIYIPGKLFSVNQRTTRQVNQLFARNERVVCIFETQAGPMAVILVGAFFVASISTQWAGTIAPSSYDKPKVWTYGKDIYYNKGDEIGQFRFGSTVIVLFANHKATWLSELCSNNTLKMGQLIGQAFK